MDFLIEKVEQKDYNKTKANTEKETDNRFANDVVADRLFWNLRRVDDLGAAAVENINQSVRRKFQNCRNNFIGNVGIR